MGKIVMFGIGIGLFLFGLIGEGFFSWLLGSAGPSFFGVLVVPRVVQYVVMSIGVYLVYYALGLKRKTIKRSGDYAD